MKYLTCHHPEILQFSRTNDPAMLESSMHTPTQDGGERQNNQWGHPSNAKPQKILARLESNPAPLAMLKSITVNHLKNSAQRPKQTKRPSVQNEKSIRLENAKQLCPKHEKEIQVLCLDDMTFLCIDCILKKRHKNHKMAPLRKVFKKM